MARTGNSSEKSNVDRIRALQKAVAANKRCADCKEVGPTYICLDFWTYVCQTCSGVHRSFGHRIKSISLSDWTSSEVEKLGCGGNERAAQTWLALLEPDGCPKVDTADPGSVDKLHEFIKQAYVEKKWWKQPPAAEETGSTANATGAPAATTAPAPAAPTALAAPAAPTAKAPSASPAAATAPEASAVLHHDGKPVTTIALNANGTPAAAFPNYIPVQTGQARFCKNHNASEKRVKTEPALKACIGCQVQLHTNYSEFTFCPTCSSHKEACMICGADADAPASALGKAVHAPTAAAPSGGQPQEASLPAWSADFGSIGDTSDTQLSAEPSGTAAPTTAAAVGGSAATGAALATQAAPTVAAPAAAMDLLDLDFSDPVPSSTPMQDTTPALSTPAPAPTTVNAVASVGAVSADSKVDLELLAPADGTLDLGTAVNGSAAAPPAAVKGESSFLDLDGLAFDSHPAVPPAAAGDANSASLGDKLREALLNGGGSGDGVRSVFEAAATAELEARTTTGDRLREALLKGSNDDVSRLFREFSPPQRAADTNPFHGLNGCAQVNGYNGYAPTASPAMDFSGMGPNGLAFAGKAAADVSTANMGRVSAQDLSLLGANELQGLQQMVSQAIQAKIAQDTVQKVDGLPPLGDSPFAADALEQAPAPTKEAGQFTDLLMAFHEKHPINGLESANVT